MAALGLLLFGGGLSLAQEATPTPTPEHPAHIHSGTCDELGDVVFPLENATDQPPATPVSFAASGAESAAASSTTIVEASLDDILAEEHAINVHQSEENIDVYIACGDITGTATEGALEIELMEVNDSGYSGTAMLVDNSDGTTTVTVNVIQPVTEATPAASPVASPQAGLGDATVTIAEFNYTPQTITIPVGGSVTWVNNDSAPHTATAQDREVLQSGTLNQGDSFTQTFDTPGTYEYFCEFHPNMSGTVIVE